MGTYSAGRGENWDPRKIQRMRGRIQPVREVVSREPYPVDISWTWELLVATFG